MLINLDIHAVTAGDDTANDLNRIITGVEGMSLTLHRGAAGLLGRLLEGEGKPDVLLVEVAQDDKTTLRELEVLLEGDAGVTVFAVTDAANADLLRRLMRAGVRDVLARPLDRQEVLTVLSALLSEKRARAVSAGENVTSVCTFLNAKGGSGSTMLAVNTACMLAERHKAKVALLDFDLQFGDAALFLDLSPQNTVSDALRQADRIDGLLLKSMMTEHAASGVHVLASPCDLTTALDVSATAVRRVIEAAASVYDVVIIDLPRVVTAWTLEAVRSSTTTFIVVQNNLATIRDARLLVDYLPRSGIDLRHLELVNNRAMAKAPSVPIDQLKETLHKERAHRVRSDYEAAVSAEDQGIPLGKVAPRSALTHDVAALADYIWVAHGHAPGGGSRKESWLARLLHGKPAADAGKQGTGKG